jgi:nitroreductase
MTFLELALARRSVRRYSNRMPEPGSVELCVEAARLAPSASNGQPWRFVVVDEPALKDSVARACFGPGTTFNRFATQAPIIAVLVIEKSTRINRVGAAIKGRDYPFMDVGIAAEHFCLQAAELSLGTCMIGWFDERKIKKLLGIPAARRIGLLVALGYPDEAEAGSPRSKTRKALGSILGRNRY